MSIIDAKALKVGDPVVTCNGKYRQDSFVTKIEPHQSGYGYWISFRWKHRGKEFNGRKRHNSVYKLPHGL